MKLAFLFLKAATALSSVVALGILAIIVLLQSFATFAKESLGVLGALAVMLTSAFQKSPQVKDPTGWDISRPQIALGILFLSMLVSVFVPGAKIFLHTVAVMAALAVGGCLWISFATPRTELIYLPFLCVWFAYYLACYNWAWRAFGPLP